MSDLHWMRQAVIMQYQHALSVRCDIISHWIHHHESIETKDAKTEGGILVASPVQSLRPDAGAVREASNA